MLNLVMIFITWKIQIKPLEDTCIHESCLHSCTQRSWGHRGHRGSSLGSSWLRIVNNCETNGCKVLAEGYCSFRSPVSQWKGIRWELTQLAGLIAHIFRAFTNAIFPFDLNLFPIIVAPWTTYVSWQNPTDQKKRKEKSFTFQKQLSVQFLQKNTYIWANSRNPWNAVSLILTRGLIERSLKSRDFKS